MKKFLYQEADFYGASKLIFGKKQLPICYKASWMHGLGYIFFNNVDSNVLIHYNEDFLPIHLVNNNDTKELLNSEGRNSIAVGMPYIYTKSFSKNKKQKTLYKRIFMPNHMIAKFKRNANDYSKWKNIISKYGCDAICLATSDYINLSNTNILGNVKLIQGAYAGDSSSLERISKIFFSTEEVITDAIGSHIVYASASGVKIKLIDAIKDNYKFSTKIPYGVPLKARKSFRDYYKSKKKLSSLIWTSGNNAEIMEYSKYILGIKHKKSKETMQNYLTPKNNLQKMGIMSRLLINNISSRLESYKKF
jgi:hypothetical protein